MQAAQSIQPSLQTHLNTLYPGSGYGAPIEVNTPYSGVFGVHPAEVYDLDRRGIGAMITKIEELGLSQKLLDPRGFSQEDLKVDVVLSSGGMRSSATQLVFTNENAFHKFKEAMLQHQSQRDQTRSLLAQLSTKYPKKT